MDERLAKVVAAALAIARAEGAEAMRERAARYVETCTLGQYECAAAIRALDVEDARGGKP
jgi:hypothetical protein